MGFGRFLFMLWLGFWLLRSLRWLVLNGDVQGQPGRPGRRFDGRGPMPPFDVPPRPQQAPPPPPPPRTSPYAVLGVAPGASLDEIRRAYRRAVQQYHPDQLAHLAPELRELAERRTKEINAAYNLLKASVRP